MEKKILWIDDDVYSIGGLIRPLEKSGLRVDKVTTAEDAYSSLLHLSYDLIITDLILPISNHQHTVPQIVQRWSEEQYVGIGLIKWIKQELISSCPVIIMSVVDDPISGFNLEGLEIDGWMKKNGILPSVLKKNVFQILNILDVT